MTPQETSEPRPAIQRRALPTPTVCYGIIAASVLMFFWADARTSTLLSANHQRILLQAGALYGPAIRAGQWWRLLGYAIEHGGIWHLALNMQVLWALGFSFERAIGSVRFLLISIATCLGGAAFALFFNFDVVTVGASGMILGWAGALLPLADRHHQRSLMIWLGEIALISIVPNLIPGSPFRVSWAGHLGGFLFGLPCGLLLRLSASRFRLGVPIVIFTAAVLAVVASHPERLHF